MELSRDKILAYQPVSPNVDITYFGEQPPDNVPEISGKVLEHHLTSKDSLFNLATISKHPDIWQGFMDGLSYESLQIQYEHKMKYKNDWTIQLTSTHQLEKEYAASKLAELRKVQELLDKLLHRKIISAGNIEFVLGRMLAGKFLIQSGQEMVAVIKAKSQYGKGIDESFCKENLVYNLMYEDELEKYLQLAANNLS